MKILEAPFIKSKRYTEEQVIRILGEFEFGKTVTETYYFRYQFKKVTLTGK